MCGWLRRLVSNIRQEVRTMAREAELLARYKHLRRVGLELNNRLVETIPAAGSCLGWFRGSGCAGRSDLRPSGTA